MLNRGMMVSGMAWRYWVSPSPAMLNRGMTVSGMTWGYWVSPSPAMLNRGMTVSGMTWRYWVSPSPAMRIPTASGIDVLVMGLSVQVAVPRPSTPTPRDYRRWDDRPQAGWA